MTAPCRRAALLPPTDCTLLWVAAHMALEGSGHEGYRGPHLWAAGVEAPTPALLALQVTYTAPMSGEYRVTIAVGTVSVTGSPFRVPCAHPRPSEVETKVDLGSGHAFVGEPFRAVVSVRDQLGQTCVPSLKPQLVKPKPICPRRMPSWASHSTPWCPCGTSLARCASRALISKPPALNF